MKNEYLCKIEYLTGKIFGLSSWTSIDGEKEYSVSELIDLPEQDDTFADFLANVLDETKGAEKEAARQLLAILTEYRSLMIRTSSRYPRIPANPKKSYIRQMSGWGNGGQNLSWLQAQDRVRRKRTTFIVFDDKWKTYFQLSDMSHNAIYVYDGGSTGVQRTASISLLDANFERKTGAGEWRGVKIQLMKKDGE